MGMDAQSATPAVAAASQAQQGGAGAPQQNPLLARLMPLIQQRMQQQAQGQGGGTLAGGPNGGMNAYDPNPADLMSQMNSGREPGVGGGPQLALPPGGGILRGPMPSGDDASVSSPAQPIWKQIQDLGGQGTGSFAGNQAMLAKLQAAKGGGAPPQGADIALDPVVALRQKIMDVAGGGAMRRDARPGDGLPRGVRAPRQATPMPGTVPAGGDLQAKPMPGVIVDPMEPGQPNPPGARGGGARPRGIANRSRVR